MSRPTDCWVSRSFSVWLFLPSTEPLVPLVFGSFFLLQNLQLFWCFVLSSFQKYLHFLWCFAPSSFHKNFGWSLLGFYSEAQNQLAPHPLFHLQIKLQDEFLSWIGIKLCTWQAPSPLAAHPPSPGLVSQLSARYLCFHSLQSRGKKKFFRIQQGCSYLTKEFNSFSAGAGFHKPICCSCTSKDSLAVLSSSRMFEAPSNSSTINQSLKKLITNILIKLW